MWKYAYISAVIVLRDFVIQPILVMSCAYTMEAQKISLNLKNRFIHTAVTVQIKIKYAREELHKKINVTVYVLLFILYHCSVYAYVCVHILWVLQFLASCFVVLSQRFSQKCLIWLVVVVARLSLA